MRPTSVDDLSELEERLSRYPRERYPVQHATAQFHRGLVLTDAGRLEEAQQALATAAELFDPQTLPEEHAKATNGLGAVLRLAGRSREAAAAFAEAAEAFERRGLALEQGAALFNLGLARRDVGEAGAARDAFDRARQLLDPAKTPAQAAAAARELGATLLAAGDLDLARRALEQAVSLAERAGDQAGLGAAANALGLARLADGELGDAIAAFRAAVGANPRSVRPDAYAMVKANFALAYERAGDEHRARVAARQALGTPAAPEPVLTQAAAVLERLGPGEGDLLAVLDDEPRERWPAIVREDVARWVDADPAEHRREAGAWIDGQLARPESGGELAEVLLAALLELPPAAMDAVIASLLHAVADREPRARERFRADVTSAMARFHTPQLLRLRDTFARIAAEIGQGPGWS